jgi:hypothetical protein
MRFPGKFSPKTIPIAFAILVVLAYGLLLTRTGFYWDDWPFAWGAHFAGPESFLRSFLRVRPFLGPIFYVTTSLLPETPLAWQTFALLIRLALILATWWTLRNIWPNRPRQTLAAALIFLVYPGYSQHWVAFTHINQELIPLLFYILSFGATGWAWHHPARSRPRTIIALLLLLLGVFPTEYFVSIEPLRFLFIFSMLGGSLPLIQRAWKAFKTWLPYLFVWSLNAAWLFFYYRSGLYANYDVEVVGDVQTSTLGLLTSLLSASAEALIKAGLIAYAQILPLVTESFPSPTAILTLALIAITFAALTFYLSRLSTFAESVTKSVDWSADFLLIGLLGILLGRIPSWAAGLPLTLQSSFDRFNVSLMLAASLFIVGLVELLLRSQRQKLIAISLLVALGVGQQFYNANIFRRDWDRQRDIYWQLTWRAPTIEPGTVLFTDTLEIDYETDYSLTAPINWRYAPNLKSLQLPYLVFGVDMRPNRLALEPNTPIEFPYRPAHFSGNTSQSITFLAPINGCLRLLAPGDELGYQNFSERMQQAIALSNLDLITNVATLRSSAKLAPSLSQHTFLSTKNLRASVHPLTSVENIRASVLDPLTISVLGPEPHHNWCYYYTHADLARQFSNWDEIASLDHQAASLGLTPSDPLEWLPFVEAGASLGEFDQSTQRTRQAIAERPYLRKAFCAAWNRAGQRQSLPTGLLTELGCE